MSSLMTLREAVSIERIGPPSPPRWSDFDESPESGPIYERDMSTWNRARAIVDAAVEFVEAEEAHSRTLQASWRGKASGNSVADTWSVKNQSIDKLRALERGESGVQP